MTAATADGSALASPLREALGDGFGRLAPAVRAHFDQTSGTRRYRGVLDRAWIARGVRGWLARPVLWLCRRAGMFLADAGAGVPFWLTQTAADGGGRCVVRWERVLTFPHAVRRFAGAFAFDPQRGTVLEWLGAGRRLETELTCRAEAGALHVTSGRQWLRVTGLCVRVPGLLAGRARLREWQRSDGTLGTSLTVSNPLLGDVLGWEGRFEEAPTAAAGADGAGNARSTGCGPPDVAEWSPGGVP